MLKKNLFFIFVAIALVSSISSCSKQKECETKIHNCLTNRLKDSDKRYPTMLAALELLEQRNAQILVETGTSRDGARNFKGDGGSTIIFGDWATRHNSMLFSVDISASAVRKAKAATKDYAEHAEVVCKDSVEFLRTFDKPIDFLYLDSFDFKISNPEPSQKHHLKEIIAAYPKLHNKSIVMIDDCDLPHGGKGKLVIDYLTERGWRIIHKGYQVILSR